MSQLYDANDYFEDNWSFEDPISNEEITEHLNKGRTIPLIENDHFS